MREVLFRTVHGSRLYGLAHAGSDNDYYTVVTKKIGSRPGRPVRARYAKQTIHDGEDSMVVDFGTWVEMCKAGVPQALEAMFSQMPLEDKIADFRAGFRAGPAVYERYYRTIKSFALAEDETTKKRRHALRLALNLNDIARCGRFNPTLDEDWRRYISSMATKSHDDVYGLALSLAWQL